MIIVTGAVEHDGHTVLQLDKGDGNDHLHAIPNGVIEDRMEAWGIDAPEALQLLLVEAHHEQDTPVRTETSDVAAGLKEIRRQAKQVRYRGVDPKAVCARARVPEETRQAIRRAVRSEIDGNRPSEVKQAESLGRARLTAERVGDGFRRRDEEMLADEYVQEINDRARRRGRVEQR